MVSEKRHSIILNLVNSKGVITLSEIMNETNSSESTIRRDLTFLEEKGALKRIHGGAKTISSPSEELTYSEKSSKNIQAKSDIAKLASLEVNNGDSIFLDAGTTTIEIIKYLKDKNIFVVTNGLKHIDELIDNNINCYILGGKIKFTTKAIIGGDALKCINKFRFDKCFLGSNGVHISMGCTTPDTEEALIKEAAIKNSKKSYILCDDSKFGEVSLVKFGDIQDVTIITNNIENISTYKNLTEVKVVGKL